MEDKYIVIRNPYWPDIIGRWKIPYTFLHLQDPISTIPAIKEIKSCKRMIVKGRYSVFSGSFYYQFFDKTNHAIK